MAKQRALSLKASYMTQILNKYIFGDVKSERVINDVKQLRNYSFEECVINKLVPFYGKTVSQLRQICHITSTAKNVNDLYLLKC